MPRGIADERDSADRTVTPTGNKTKMNGFVEISTLLIHSAPKQKSNEWMHLSPFYTRMHGECLRYAKSTSQFHWRFLLVRDVRGFQVNPLCRHDITRSDRQIGNNPRVGNETLHSLGFGPCFGRKLQTKKRMMYSPGVPYIAVALVVTSQAVTGQQVVFLYMYTSSTGRADNVPHSDP